MKFIKQLMFIVVTCLSLTASFALAEGRDYSEAEFNKSLTTGSAIVLDFHAEWCPTCRAQSKAFETLLKEDKLSNVTVFKVDYDNSDVLKKKYGVSKQSTLILFKDGKELDRNMGVTDENDLRAFLTKGL